MLCSDESARSDRNRHPSLTAWPGSSRISTNSRAARSVRSCRDSQRSEAFGEANAQSDSGPDTCRRRRVTLLRSDKPVLPRSSTALGALQRRCLEGAAQLGPRRR